MDEAQLPRIRAAILDYLGSRPAAMDTLEGITTWWLRPESWSREAVEQAIEGLVHDGRLRASVRDGTRIFGAADPPDLDP
jgi:hypothetical protein